MNAEHSERRTLRAPSARAREVPAPRPWPLSRQPTTQAGGPEPDTGEERAPTAAPALHKGFCSAGLFKNTKSNTCFSLKKLMIMFHYNYVPLCPFQATSVGAQDGVRKNIPHERLFESTAILRAPFDFCLKPPRPARSKCRDHGNSARRSP